MNNLTYQLEHQVLMDYARGMAGSASILIKRGRIISPADGIDRVANILVDGRLISDLTAREPPAERAVRS